MEPTLSQEGVGPIKEMWSLCLGGGVWLGGGDSWSRALMSGEGAPTSTEPRMSQDACVWVLEKDGRPQHSARELELFVRSWPRSPSPPAPTRHPPPPLTCRRKRSASAARPAAIHWKEAFWPALTSTSPRREKCGAFAAEMQPWRELGQHPLSAGAAAARTPHPVPHWVRTHRRGS